MSWGRWVLVRDDSISILQAQKSLVDAFFYGNINGLFSKCATYGTRKG